MSLTIGFTGTQQGTSPAQRSALWSCLYALKMVHPGETIEVHLGDCIGADHDAHTLVRGAFPTFVLVGHPPTDPGKRAFCDYTREEPGWDDEIARADHVIACPKEYEEQRHSETWATVRQARKYRRKIHIIYPDGTFRHEADGKLILDQRTFYR